MYIKIHPFYGIQIFTEIGEFSGIDTFHGIEDSVYVNEVACIKNLSTENTECMYINVCMYVYTNYMK
mgnify:FL=1